MSAGLSASPSEEIVGFTEQHRPPEGALQEGLWIDRPDWINRLALKHRRGDISDRLSLDIFCFVRDGYIVLEAAVPPAVIDRVDQDIERFWLAPPDGLLIETWEIDGTYRLVPPDIAYRAGGTKLLDLYAFSAAAREAIACPRALEFLSAIFETPPKAFQSLNFWNGSQQDIHKDTAYVKVEPDPMHLAATWLALEDVRPGAGELSYYIGSHRAPHFLFGGASKWRDAAPEEHDRFLRSLHADAERFGHRRGTFAGKRGDVLVWHADLAHGGNPIEVPGLTRRSLVTHFTTTTAEPFYRRTSRCLEGRWGDCVFVSQYHDIG